MLPYLQETSILNYSAPEIQNLVQSRKWQQLPMEQKVQAVYNFVRDEILFGYNTADDIPATQVLQDGFGQCNTKATLLMALLRAVGVPNRIHGFTIDKALQKGAITGVWYKLSPKNIIHSWVEVWVNNQWFFLEGVIIDKSYLQQLQRLNKHCTSTFRGFGVFTDKFSNPPIDWANNHTFIQSNGINNDFGVFQSPDEFYKLHQQDLGWFKTWLFQNIVRHKMNKNVRAIRNRIQ
jgi:hypothetical protein